MRHFPQKIYLEPTTDCNLSCGMCVRHAWDAGAESMTRETFDLLLAQTRAIPSLSAIQFGGFGEPTLHPEFCTFLSGAKEAGLRAELVTNGTTLEPELLEALLDLQLDKLIVSIDGVESDGDGAFHPMLDGQVNRNLRNLYRMRLTRHTPKPEVSVQFVASRRNIRQLPEVKRLAQQLGFSSILVSNLVPHTPELADEILYARWTTGRGSACPSPWNPTIDLPRTDPHSPASEVIEQLRSTGSRLEICGNEFSGGTMYCRFVNEGYLAIAPDGGISPCLALLHSYNYYLRGEKHRVLAYRVGNVRQTALEAIWDSAEYRAFRERVRQFTFSPCIDCGGCELRESNQEDCFGNDFPCCGACLWAAGLVQCP
jgi:MoaA/NifB/PqqE/SkfB family radical SAM enzyme